ncbi:MAG: LLM class flavin-dependent oxidoreductase, partial [Bosea sp. (in: a-proteobacteria)]|nr:LLM class flavin-dependent oxidoreductase [Bosea sp. (in: a-proteobacteria)]
AAATKTIRVGAGGIMLPNHAPLIIAEQFGTLEALFPGRIDLGLGRAPGTDQMTMRAMRRSPMSSDSFPQDVLELQAYFAPAGPNQAIQAVPGAGLNVPLWILGSSLFGSQLAAELGLPYAFASHFAPDALMQALAVYRERFKPSEQLARPHAMPGINVIAAETDAEARYLATSLQQRFVDMVRGQRGKLQPPIDDIETYWSPAEKAHVAGMLRYAFIGSPETLKRQLGAFIAATQADEIMVTAPIFDHEARKRSYAILAEIAPEIGLDAKAA